MNNRLPPIRILAHLAAGGWLRRIQRGLYTTVPLGASEPSSWRADPWVVAARVFDPCYLGGWTALEHWGLTEQLFRDIVVFTARNVRSRDRQLQDVRYRLRQRDEELHFGTTRVWREHGAADVSNPERTLVDVLDDPGLGGGMRHVADCLVARVDEGLDQERLIDYAHRLGNGAVFKRLGFLVETLQLDVPQLVAECQECQSTGISALDPTVDRKGRIVSRWNLRVNVDVSDGNNARSVPGRGYPADRWPLGLALVLNLSTIVLEMSTQGNGLATTLFGQTRRRILALLFASPGEEFYVREIVRATATSPGAVQRELGALESAGIISRRARGNQVFYSPNRKCPIFTELRDIMMKTAGLADVLRRALSPVRSELVAAFVFGSLARGEGDVDSDVDLMVIGEVGFGEVVECLQGAQETLRREVNPVVRSPEEFRRRLREDDHFLTRILEEPLLFVLGGPDELGELGGERLVGRSRDQ